MTLLSLDFIVDKNSVMGQLDNLTHIQAPTFRLDFSRL